MMIVRFDVAQVEFEQSIRYNPQSAEMHYNLGKLFSMQDNWENARKEFEAALQIDSDYIEAIDALGLTQEALQDNSGAVASYERAIALNAERRGFFTSAQVNLSAYYNRTSDPAKALEYAKEALALDPKSDRAWFQKGKADEGQGRRRCRKPGHLLQPSSLVLLLCSRWPVPAAGQDRRKPESIRVFHSSREGVERTRQDAAQQSESFNGSVPARGRA
jgi:tetratricopeptide (TPR) repeat protein